VVVPIEATSEKEEWAARTIRNKINSKINTYSQKVLVKILKIGRKC
jgi:hypothetical protein